tara:strand:+ start:10886 stop:11866 length:981 start_codon:yes stop_codon:yes gene_type:complete
MLRTISPGVSKLIRHLLLIIVFIISWIVGSLYTTGDQLNYTNVYNNISSYEIVPALVYYRFHLNSLELVHFFFIYFLSAYFEKVLLFSILNTFFAYLIIRYFDQLKVSLLVTASFITTNFYVYVLFFTAERLKFGLLILLIGLCMKAGSKLRLLTIFSSIFGHAQVVLILAPIIFEDGIRRLIKMLKTSRLKWSTLLFIIPLLLIPFIWEYALFKFQSYRDNVIDSTSIFSFLRVTTFFILAAFYANKVETISKAFIVFIPLFIMVYLIGGDRVNMIAYMYFLYFALRYKNGLNAGILITTLYFFWKTIMFLVSISIYGNGFNQVY